MSREKVLGYPVDVVTEDEAVARVENALVAQKGMHVVTLNAEMVVQAQKDLILDRIIRRAHLIVPDGAGAVFALRLDGHPSVRVPGIELAYRCLSLAAANAIPTALIGGRQEVLDTLELKLKEQFPDLNIVASHNGYIQPEEEESVIETIASARPRLVLVAMGVPRQEYFIEKWSSSFPSAVMIGVGGSFDVWAGFVNRAPAIFRALNLEWLYRLLKEPWRASRILTALPKFAFQVLARRFLGAERVYSEDERSPGRAGGRWRRVKKSARNQDRSKDKSRDQLR